LQFLKKINATKNFNAGAIIATSNRQFLAKKRHTMYRSLRSVHPSFAQFALLPKPQTSMLYNTFQSSRHP